MGAFDFLNKLGEFKNSFNILNLESIINEEIEFMEILISRNLLQESFRNELVKKYMNKEISTDDLSRYIQKSINLHNSLEIKFVLVDDEEFKFRNDTLEYIGAIDRMPDDKLILSPNRGMVSYNFVVSLFNQLKGRTLKLSEVIALSDALDFKLMKVYHYEQLTK